MQARRSCAKNEQRFYSFLTHTNLSLLDWEEREKAHGRIERRSIIVVEAYSHMTDYPHVKQAFRVRRETRNMKTKKRNVEHAYGITSADSDKASPEDLLTLNRGHWAVEARNHQIRDVTFGEDASRLRTGSGPANNAMCSNIALAVILQRKFETVPAATMHFSMHRDEAFEATGLRPG